MGAYNFTALIQFSPRAIPLAGTLEITADTVLLSVEGLYCRAVWGSFETLVYACEGATLPDVSQMTVTFDRRFPLQRPSVSAVVTIFGTRSVCEQYERNEIRELVCMRWRTKAVHRNELRDARLHTTRKRAGAA